MVYLIEALCKPTNEVYFGVRTQTLAQFIKGCRNPTYELFGQRLHQYGVDKFSFRVIATYTNQIPAIARANELIQNAMDKERSLNSSLLYASCKRNARI